MTTTSKELVWTTALGKKKKISEIDQQHLSNILWFCEIFWNWNRYNSDTMFMIGLELAKRFPGETKNGERLEWRPLPIPNEIAWIKKTCTIKDGDIYRKSERIGTLSHIENWETL